MVLKSRWTCIFFKMAEIVSYYLNTVALKVPKTPHC